MKNVNETSFCGLIGPYALSQKPHIQKIPHPKIFIDGGFRHRSRISSSLSLLIGDNDSLKLKNPKKYFDYLLPQDKDFSDFSFALNLCPNDLDFLYADGFFPNNEKRFDHLLSLIGESYLANKPYPTILHAHLAIFPVGKWHILIQGIFGLTAFQEGNVSLRSNGLMGKIKYSCHQQKILPMSSRYLGNEGSGVLELECSVPIILSTHSKSFVIGQKLPFLKFC